MSRPRPTSALPAVFAAALAALVAGLVAAPTAMAGEGLAVEGSDHLRLRPTAGAAALEEYANAGYRLLRPQRDGGGDAADGAAEWVVEVSLAPLRSTAPFALPAVPPAAASEPDGMPSLAQVARQATAGATDRYAAVSAVLGWMVSHVSEAASAAETVGDPEAVLARGRGDAAAVARLAVALLAAVEIEARVVHGRVVGEPEVGSPHGPHTWIEVHYPDRGWCFSDPLYHHHYVPATYVRFASGDGGSPAAPPPSAWARVVERRDRRQTVDLYPAAGPGVTARKNAAGQVAGALRVVVSGGGRGSAVLADADSRRSRALVDGESIFVGLSGGSYRLEVYVEGRPPMVRDVELAAKQRTAVFLRDDRVSQRPARPGGAPSVHRRRDGAGSPAP